MPRTNPLSSALPFRAFCWAMETGLFKSEVLSTSDSPIAAFVTACTGSGAATGGAVGSGAVVSAGSETVVSEGSGAGVGVGVVVATAGLAVTAVSASKPPLVAAKRPRLKRARRCMPTLPVFPKMFPQNNAFRALVIKHDRRLVANKV